MLEVPVYNTSGEKIDTLQVDPAWLGDEVNSSLLKQAIVTYHANRRQGTVMTRGRSQVEGSTRKLYRQKGTGNARRGQIRTNVMRGGGVAFGKMPRDYRKRMPKKMRRAALNSALLAKIQGQSLLVLDELVMDAPRTKTLWQMLDKLDVHRSCLLVLNERDRNVYLSSRNLQDLTVRVAEELNAFDVATRQKMIITRQAAQALLAQEVTA
jgi:large subunit ribosomal protein L4